MEYGLTASGAVCYKPRECFWELMKENITKKSRQDDQEKWLESKLTFYQPAYFQEVRCMMYTHGDAKKSFRKSVLFMEIIVREQMTKLLRKASTTGQKLKRNILTHENLLPLLVNSKTKMKRLLKYLKMKDVKDCISKRNQEPLADLVDGVELGKKVKTCLEFLTQQDGFDEATAMDNSVIDPGTTRRQQRRFVTTHLLNKTNYLEFSEMLKASFLPKDGESEFRNWLLRDDVAHLVPTKLALEIINFLAYETVAEIVDLCLWWRYKRTKPQSVDDSAPCMDQDFENMDLKKMDSRETVKHMSKAFGDEFKNGVMNRPITPAEIREVINLVSGFHGSDCNLLWVQTQPSLFCTEDNDDIDSYRQLFK